ncbi:unnamed protein product [Polarella glacialis]|uniref:Uncharacterized protein n=1 Tax=Polarella glacialis TaxID=89957 RepID=A0A813DES0_POLGL|nr:unnamed protein product [Polarella glacialis]CAE8652462.1 unnamed protein product [Polarella glacialis]
MSPEEIIVWSVVGSVALCLYCLALRVCASSATVSPGPGRIVDSGSGSDSDDGRVADQAVEDPWRRGTGAESRGGAVAEGEALDASRRRPGAQPRPADAPQREGEQGALFSHGKQHK